MHTALRQAYQLARNSSADVSTGAALKPRPLVEQQCIAIEVPVVGVRVYDAPTEEERIAAWVVRQKRRIPQLRPWNDAKHPSILLIQQIICETYNIKRIDLLSGRRTKELVIPRQIAMYLAKQMTLFSLPGIGSKFGQRDHTTVLHAVRKIDAMVKQDTELAGQIDALKKLIAEAA